MNPDNLWAFPILLILSVWNETFRAGKNVTSSMLNAVTIRTVREELENYSETFSRNKANKNLVFVAKHNEAGKKDINHEINFR